jgi:two-component system response regulator AtoC
VTNESTNITIKLFSDIEDISSIKSALSKLKSHNYNLEISGQKISQIDEGDIIISLIQSIESPIITELVSYLNYLNRKFLFVTLSNDAVLVATLAKLGFNDIFVFPYEIYKFSLYLDEVLEDFEGRLKGRSLLFEKDGGFNFDDFIGKSESILKIRNLAQKIAAEPQLNILILGETGTGKGLLAKLIHNNSLNKTNSFVDVLCTAIPEALLESELFGHEKGAFTNAQSRKLGLFEIAENGTLFLDEIGDLSLNLQSKLLRVIEKKIIRRLGGVTDIPVNARIISATNRRLKEMVEGNLFRNDLYYRLNTVSIEIPPLRERADDIILLTEYFIKDYSIQFNKKITRMDAELENFILSYNWPGNVRELKNSVERAVLLSEGKSLKLRNFSSIINYNPTPEPDKNAGLSQLPHIIQLQLNYISTDLEKLNQIYAEEILKKFSGNKSKASQQLGISRPKLDKLLKK